MLPRVVRMWTYIPALWLSFALPIAVGVYGIFTEDLLPVWRNWNLAPVVRFCERTDTFAVPLLTLATVVVIGWTRWAESPTLMNAVHGLLNEIQRVALSNLENLPEHERRVTLFKYVWWRWTLRAKPWGGWLVAYERSGDTTRTRISAFRAPLSQPGRAEGVAGQAFVRGVVVLTGLLSPISEESTEEAIADYAKRTHVSTEWVFRWMSGHPKQNAPRSICAIPVVAAGGRRWGVLVFDACGDIKYSKTIQSKQFTLYSGLLGQLLAK
jgi:hypothetical protein